MSVTCLARRKKVKGNGPNKDSAHEVHRLLETKPSQGRLSSRGLERECFAPDSPLITMTEPTSRYL
ncbi:hypothetical protein YC2023_037490 [Brassica napus]